MAHGQAMSMGPMIIMLAFSALMVASMWRVFEKAGKPGWAALVPIYNFVVMLQIAAMPTWQIVLVFVPFANLYVAVKVSTGIAEKFGKSVGFGLGLAFLGFIFFPMLAFGDAAYASGRPGPAPAGMRRAG